MVFSRRTSTAVVVFLVLLVTFALVASALPVFAAPASALPAHARLVTTTPADGAEVGTARSVGLTFSEDVDARFLRLVVEGPGGKETEGAPEVDGRDVTQALVADLPAGEHTVTYRVVSVDGHPVAGSFTFTTTEAPTSPSATPTPSATPSTVTPSTTTAPTPTSSPGTVPAAQSGSPGWVLPVVVLVVVALLGGLVALLSGRRGGRPDETSDDVS